VDVGGASDLLGGELGVVHDATEATNDTVGNVVAVKLHQSAHKLLIAQHPLGAVPVRLLLLPVTNVAVSAGAPQTEREPMKWSVNDKIMLIHK
jgi:hypothetical protein